MEYQSLKEKSAKELRAILDQRGVSYGDCVEKDDLIRRIEETKDVVPPQSEETIAGLSCHIVPNSARPIIILGKKLKAEKVDAVFVFPNAFLPLVGGSSTQRAWWPIDFQALFGEVLSDRLHLHIPPGLEEARKRMIGLVEALKERYKLPTKRIVLGGFSQGAMLTTDVALHLPEPPAALLLLSGTLVAEPVWKTIVANRKGLRVIQQHGTNDQILPYRNAEQLRDFLKGGELDVDFISFGGGHHLGPQTLPKILGLLLQLGKQQ